MSRQLEVAERAGVLRSEGGSVPPVSGGTGVVDVGPLRGRLPILEEAAEGLKGPEGRLDRRALGAIGEVAVRDGPVDGLDRREKAVRPKSPGQAQGRHVERVPGGARVLGAETRVFDGDGGEKEAAREVARGVEGFDGEAFDDWPPEVFRRRIALQKIGDLEVEGVKGVGLGGHPPDELPSPLAPPRFFWEEESRCMPPPSCSSLAGGAISLEQFTPPL
jgi:hypothetical protein